MKKKLTVGIFLALVVVLVASIVVVGDADAAKPERLTVDVAYIPNGDDTANVTFTVSWEKLGAWSFEWFFGNLTIGESDQWTEIAKGYREFPDGRTSSWYEVLAAESNLPCGQKYHGSVHLKKKNGTFIHGSTAFMTVPFPCPTPTP